MCCVDVTRRRYQRSGEGWSNLICEQTVLEDKLPAKRCDRIEYIEMDNISHAAIRLLERDCYPRAVQVHIALTFRVMFQRNGTS